jgi:hypothetical protein
MGDQSLFGGNCDPGLLGFEAGAEFLRPAGALCHVVPRRFGTKTARSNVVEDGRFGFVTSFGRSGRIEFTLRQWQILSLPPAGS